MLKQILNRFIHGFCYSIAITLVIQVVVMLLTKEVPMLPEYMSRFDNMIAAFSLQLVLIGIMSGVTSSGTVIFEAKKIGYMIQCVLFLAIMLCAWIPVSCYVWGFHKYTTSMITTITSIVVTYSICWAIHFIQCRKDIAAINAKLLEKKENKHECSN